jgi:2-hydroxy-6-oxonona-2,4-dienedioate hydrolase
MVPTMTEPPPETKVRRRTLGIVALAGLAGAVLGGAWVQRAYAADLAAARARLDGRSRMLDTRAGPVEVAVGPGAGSGQQPVLMVHGTGGGFDMGLQFGERLGAAGWQVIAPSRFGYLRTPLPSDHSVEAQADAFVALLDALGIERVPVIGGSAGALSAIQFALRYPQRCTALVAVVPATYTPQRAATPAAAPWAVPITEALLRSDFLFWSAIRAAPDAMIGALLATDPALVAAAPPAEQARVRRVLWNILPVSQRADGLLNDARQSSRPAPVAMQHIRVPTLAVSCEDDRFGTFLAAQHIATMVPGARLLSFPTGGHVWVGHDADLFAAVHAFLEPLR